MNTEPWNSPIAVPANTPAAIARYGAQPCLTLSTAMIAAHRPLTAPTERSISPSSSTSTTPIEISPTAVIWSTRLVRLTAVRKRVSCELEDQPDQGEHEDDPQLREVARDEAPQELAPGDSGPRRPRRRRSRHPHSSLASVPRSARDRATTSSWLASRPNSPAFWPSRSTKMRSATSKTSTRLWLITSTPSRGRAGA